MTKPIFIVKFPGNCSMVRMVEGVDKLSKMNDLSNEYHVIPVSAGSSDYVEFEVLNVLSSTDIEIEELKNKVLKQLTQTKDEHATTI